MENPFQFGSWVDEPYFTDRKEELRYIVQYLNSENHLILISPRRYGKSSLVAKAVRQTGRPFVFLNLQQVTSISDFAAMIVREVYKLYPLEKVKHLLANFRIIPVISTSPMGDSFDISFNAKVLNSSILLEDALALLEHVSTPEKKLIVVLDEFPELLEVEKRVDKRLRAIMQEQHGLNYIFLGSQESMMTDIFMKVKSPFYHFGATMHLNKIPYDDLHAFIVDRMQPLAGEGSASIAEKVLAFTTCHPYYTQQLASKCWDIMAMREQQEDVVSQAIGQLVHSHDLDFERLWLTFTRVSRKVMQLLARGEQPYQDRNLPTSTSYSALKKLMKDGYVIRTDQYEIEDPFMKQWITDQMAV